MLGNACVQVEGSFLGSPLAFGFILRRQQLLVQSQARAQTALLGRRIEGSSDLSSPWKGKLKNTENTIQVGTGTLGPLLREAPFLTHALLSAS